MNKSRNVALSFAVTAGVLGAVSVAPSAHAITYPSSIYHQGCRLTVYTPEFKDKWTAGGVKIVDYPYQLTCNRSSAGVTVEVLLERWESDLATRPGDPDTKDEFTGSVKHLRHFPAAGASRNVISDAALPRTDDTDQREEMYTVAKFRVKSGAVQGNWSPLVLSPKARAIQR